MSGREFDVQVVHTPPESPRGKVMQQYVLARIMSMEGINIGLYDYDRHNALYFFGVNADEDIYFRYGGRDAASPDTYLDFNSLELALRKGLELHALHKAGKWIGSPRPTARYPRDIPGVQEAVLGQRRCMECHHIAHFETMELERTGKLDKLRHMFRSPDEKKIGIHFDIPKGLQIAKTEGPAAEAGMKAGDAIVAIESTPVLTFGDFQYRFDQVDRNSSALALTVEREEEKLDLSVSLPKGWFVTDLSHRYYTIEPKVYFESEPLTEAEKKSLDLPVDGFAVRVTEAPIEAMLEDVHELENGDVIYSVNGVEKDEALGSLSLHIKVIHRAGDTLQLGVIRGSERIELKLNTQRKTYRI
ncbi:MAG: Trx7/PDZ domain-containing (seleno)protein [Verrucomicrobiota bacterium]